MNENFDLSANHTFTLKIYIPSGGLSGNQNNQISLKLQDGTQGAPHCDIDMQKIGCDFYAISCHKMYGPNGLGILYMKKKWVDDLPPYQGGGGMINEVKKEDITFAEKNTKFEAGTMQTAEVVSFSESLNFIEKLGINNIASHENEILEYGLEKLRKNNSIKRSP